MFTIIKERKQRTIRHPVSFSGIGLHTGQKNRVRLLPALENRGRIFHRVDKKKEIPALAKYACCSERNTALEHEKARVETIEHLLSAICAFQIDNIVVELDGDEIPALDGSAEGHVALLEQAGVVEQAASLPIYSLSQPIYYSEEQAQLVALPACEYRMSYMLDYPNVDALRSQFFDLVLSKETFKKEIASSRTFCLYEELDALLNHNLLRGGSLNNGMVVCDDAVISKKKRKSPYNEMVRHKLLDLIGDLVLVGVEFAAHIIAIRSGHRINALFAKKMSDFFSHQLAGC